MLAHVARCIAEGRRESPVMPLDETLAIVRTMDSIRAQIGLRYPADDGRSAGDDYDDQ